jgi:hypothetical protein
MKEEGEITNNIYDIMGIAQKKIPLIGRIQKNSLFIRS